MNLLWLGLVVLVVSGPLWMALGLFRQPSAPDDTLALCLAAALDGTAPQLVQSPWGGLRHRIDFTREGARSELFVARTGGTLRRLGVHADHAARIFSAPLQGRAQEDYAGGRALIPDGEGWVLAQHGPALHGWETRLPAGFAASMQMLPVPILIVDRTSLRASAPEIDVDWVETTAELLATLQATFPPP